MPRKVRSKLHRYRSIIRETANWPDYMAFKLGLHRGGDFTFRLRDGSIYTVEKRMMGPFRECFFDDQYLRHIDATGLPTNPVVIDIGANVGFAALYFLHRFPKATVHSFEPMPYMQGLLHKRRAEHPETDWHIHDFGVWKEDGTLELFTSHVDDFTAVSGIVRLEKTGHRVEVKVRRLDGFLEEHGMKRVDLLKLDCEGAEYGILFSLPDEVYEGILNIALETHETEEWKTLDMVRHLRSKGYEVVYEDRGATGHVWARRIPGKNR